ncbi:MAG: methyltransferase domain-containing protein, partial [Brasilonema sp.]
LMQAIRAGVDRHKTQYQTTTVTYKPEIYYETSTKFNLIFNHIETLIRDAESRAIIRTKWPDNLKKFPWNLTNFLQKIALKILGFIFKDQREVNFNLIKALRESVNLNRQLIEQIKSERAQMDERTGAMYSHISEIDESLDNINNINSWVSEIQKRLDAVDSREQKMNEHLEVVDTHLQRIYERYLRNDVYLKNDLMEQKPLITMFLEQAQRRLPEPLSKEQLQTFVNEEQHSLDAFYVAFEDQFRGSREDILKRLKVYLPFIEEAKVGTPDFPILDVGCGRGEWLELLRDSGYTAKGLDINRVMLEQCSAKGLDVSESDVISYLQSLPDASLGAITGFHIIEHLQFPVLIKLFDETLRVLKHGGLAIFETPNPQNVIVGSCNFYFDPSHRNPLPSLMIEFVAQYSGLTRINILNLNPSESSRVNEDSELAKRFNQYFYDAMDYAVIGYKP